MLGGLVGEFTGGRLPVDDNNNMVRKCIGFRFHQFTKPYLHHHCSIRDCWYLAEGLQDVRLDLDGEAGLVALDELVDALKVVLDYADGIHLCQISSTTSLNFLMTNSIWKLSHQNPSRNGRRILHYLKPSFDSKKS